LGRIPFFVDKNKHLFQLYGISAKNDLHSEFPDDVGLDDAIGKRKAHGAIAADIPRSPFRKINLAIPGDFRDNNPARKAIVVARPAKINPNPSVEA
jgi:hypothetical protein